MDAKIFYRMNHKGDFLESWLMVIWTDENFSVNAIGCGGQNMQDKVTHTVDEYRNWYTDTLGILSNLFKSISFVKWTLDSSVSDGSVIKFKWVSSSIFQSDIEEGSSVRRTTIAAASATVTRSLSRKTCINPQVKINRDKIRAWKKPYNLLKLYSPVPTS